jgi:hypothetical protein
MDANRSRRVIGGDDVSVARVEREINWVLAAAGLLVERGQLAVVFVDRVSADLVKIGMN